MLNLELEVLDKSRDTELKAKEHCRASGVSQEKQVQYTKVAAQPGVLDQCQTTCQHIQQPLHHYSKFRGWRKAPEGITLMFGNIRISYLFDKYSPASGALSPR